MARNWLYSDTELDSHHATCLLRSFREHRNHFFLVVSLLTNKHTYCHVHLQCTVNQHFTFQVVRVRVQVLQSCPTLCDPMDCSLPGSSWDSPGKSIGVGCHALLQRIFLTRIQPASPTSQVDSLPLSHQGSPLCCGCHLFCNSM